MKLKHISLLTLAGMLSTAISAQEIDYNKAETWGHPQIKAGTDGAALNVLTPTSAKHNTLIKLDKNATYTFSGEIRRAPGTPEAPYLIGFFAYDKNRRLISPQNMAYVKGTQTELVETAVYKSKTLKVKDASKWQKGSWFFVAFDAKDDLSDLPNFNLSANGISDIKKVEDGWLVTLAKPLIRGWVEETKVRVHFPGSWHHYTGTGKTKENWVKFGRKFKGISKSGNGEYGKFWANVEYIAPMMILNNKYDKNKEKYNTQLRNLKVEIIK